MVWTFPKHGLLPRGHLSALKTQMPSELEAQEVGKTRSLDARCNKEVGEQCGWRKREYLLSRTLHGHFVQLLLWDSCVLRGKASSPPWMGLSLGDIQWKQGKVRDLPASTASSDTKCHPLKSSRNSLSIRLVSDGRRTHSPGSSELMSQSWESGWSCSARQILISEESRPWTSRCLMMLAGCCGGPQSLMSH